MLFGVLPDSNISEYKFHGYKAIQYKWQEYNWKKLDCVLLKRGVIACRKIAYI